MKRGIQLFNFGKELGEDFRGTLRRISELGFDGVEFACRYGDIAPDDLAAFLKELHLECAGTMFTPDELLDKDNIAYEYARKLNSPAVTSSTPTASDFTAVWPEIAERCRKIGDIAAANGVAFSYHNHWGEFTLVDGVSAMDRILAANDENKVLVEPDVCWVTRGGGDPADYIRRYAHRIRQIHFKDMLDLNERYSTSPLGTGVIDLESCYRAALESDAEWYIYEQDACDDAFACAKKSLEFMKHLGETVRQGDGQ
ncbi:MAG: sugar phosphate isomerase/epimerase [Victivallaceae bacterium]|nr:sugar phosphate isomerase/epimerase [Victivallaceae bacterium]